MKNATRASLAAAALAVAGCDPLLYAKLDDPSVRITDTISAPGLPAVQVPATPLIQYAFDIGNITIDELSKDSRLTVNGATLALIGASDPATTFAGIESASIGVAGPDGSNLPTQIVATYDRTRDGPAGTTLALAGDPAVNLVPYLSDHTLTVVLTGSGVPPGPAGITWKADLTIDFHVIAQKNLP